MPITCDQFFHRVCVSGPLGRIPTLKDLDDARKGLETSDQEYKAAVARRLCVRDHYLINPASPALADLLRQHTLATDLAETRRQLWHARVLDYTRRYQAGRVIDGH